MSKVAIIGVGQSAFVRSYPGSIRELAFDGFKEAMQDAQLTTKDVEASVICSAPEYDKQRSPAGVFAEYLGLNPQPTFTLKACVLPAAWELSWPIHWSNPDFMTWSL